MTEYRYPGKKAHLEDYKCLHLNWFYHAIILKYCLSLHNRRHTHNPRTNTRRPYIGHTCNVNIRQCNCK